MTNKDIQNVIREEIENALRKKIEAGVKQRLPQLYKIAEKFLDSKEFDKLARKAITDMLRYQMEEENTHDLMTARDSKKLWDRISKNMLAMVKRK